MKENLIENGEVLPIKGLFIDDDIAVLDMTVRSYNCLRRAGIQTISELLHTPTASLPEIKNLGAKNVQEITNFIQRLKISTILD